MDKKFEATKNQDDKKVGKSQKKYEQSSKEKEKIVEKDSENVTLIFKGNRTFELHIGRAMYRFEGRVSKQVPRSVLSHPDFANVKKYFVIGE